MKQISTDLGDTAMLSVWKIEHLINSTRWPASCLFERCFPGTGAPPCDLLLSVSWFCLCSWGCMRCTQSPVSQPWRRVLDMLQDSTGRVEFPPPISRPKAMNVWGANVLNTGVPDPKGMWGASVLQ